MVYYGRERGGKDQNDRPISEYLKNTVLDRLAAKRKLVLKRGAQVMLLKASLCEIS